MDSIKILQALSRANPAKPDIKQELLRHGIYWQTIAFWCRSGLSFSDIAQMLGTQSEPIYPEPIDPPCNPTGDQK